MHVNYLTPRSVFTTLFSVRYALMPRNGFITQIFVSVRYEPKLKEELSNEHDQL
jgi:hypothetical protein